MSIITNVVLCSFTTGELTIQSTSNSIQCSLPNKYNNNFYNNQTSICFDLNGNSCVITKGNSCHLTNTNYLSCIGNYMECSSQNTVCSTENSIFNVNYAQYYLTEYDSRSDANPGSYSNNSKIPPFITFILSFLLILITMFIIS
ncbi:hypothetical protein ACTFIZ_003436 [Dictyostelium cf. discoideum]